MKAGIIAAGLGERLMKGGVATPKPLVSIDREPLIARAIHAASYVKATSVACIVNDQSPAVTNYLRSSSWPIPLELIVKTTPSSMESLFSLGPSLGSEPFLLLTVDAVFDFNALRRFLIKARELDGDGVLAVTSFVDDEKPLWVKLDKSQRIVSMGKEAQPGPYITAGFYYFKPNIFSMVEAARARGLNALRQFLGFLLEKEYGLYGIPVPKTVDVDCPEDIEKARRYVEEMGKKCRT